MSKNLISCVCALSICFSAYIPICIANEYTENGITYEYSDRGNGGIRITKIETDSNTVVLPSEIDDKKVTELSDSAIREMQRNDYIKNIVFPDGFKDVSCTNMTRLEMVILPGDLTEISDSCFRGCSSLKKIVIPDTVKRIGHMGFMDCTSLESITIPDSVEYIGQEAFHGCSSLVKIEWSGKSELHDNVFTGTPYLREGRDDCILTDNSKTFYSWGGKSRVAEIPEGVTSIAHGAFMESDIEKVICPKSMTTISNQAFFEAKSVKEVEFKGNVTEFEPSAFGYCSSLSKLNIPETVTNIPEMCFNYCTSLTEIEIPDTVTSINQYAFYGCENVKSIKLSNNCSIIPWGCFGMCISITDITIPSSVKKIENEAFAQCSNLVTVNIGSDVEVGDDAFAKTPYGKANNLPESTVKPSNRTTEEPEATRKPKETESPLATPEITREPLATEAPKNAATLPETIDVRSGDKIEIEVNNRAVTFPDAQPFIDENGRTKIPIRAVAEALDCEVSWDAASQTAAITRGERRIYITIGNNILQAGSNLITMDTAAEIKDERTYIPVRFVGEALGMAVNWVE